MDGANDALERFLIHSRNYDGSLNSFWSLRDEFGILALSGFFLGWVNRHLAELIRSPSEAGLWFWPQFNIHEANGLTLSVAALAEQSTIQTHAEPAMYTPIDGQDLHCHRYRLPPHVNDVFDPAIVLEPTGSRTVKRGEVLEVWPDQVYDFQATTKEQPVVAAVLQAPVSMRFKWSFHRSSLKALAAVDADAADTQLRATCDLLGQLGDPSSLEILEGLIGHNHHGVRWSAIQNIVRINPAAARSLLERSVTDPHPHIQAAAAKTLQKLTASS